MPVDLILAEACNSKNSLMTIKLVLPVILCRIPNKTRRLVTNGLGVGLKWMPNSDHHKMTNLSVHASQQATLKVARYIENLTDLLYDYFIFPMHFYSHEEVRAKM